MSRQSSPAAHSITFSWREQGPLFAADAEQSGLEYLRGLASGDIVPPPVAQVLGITVVGADPGKVRMTMPVHGHLINHLGFLAGGILSTAIDAALGCAVLSAVAPDRDVVTLDVNVDFVRPVTEASGLVTVDAEVVHLGRSRGLATCRALDSDQQLCAIGKSSCLIRSKSPHRDSPQSRRRRP